MDKREQIEQCTLKSVFILLVSKTWFRKEKKRGLKHAVSEHEQIEMRLSSECGASAEVVSRKKLSLFQNSPLTVLCFELVIVLAECAFDFT